MIKNIALVMPKFSEGFSLDSIPLSLSYIGAVLKREGYMVDGYNLQYDIFDDPSYYQLIGISTTSAMIDSAIKLARDIKKSSKPVTIVLGGAHVSAVKDEVLKYEEIDYAIYGEGEVPLLALINVINTGSESLSDVPNLIYRDEFGNKKISQKYYSIKDLDDLPFPDKGIFDVSNYPDKVQAYGDIIGTRGCPFKCTNCKPGLDGTGRFRWRSPASIVKEMIFLESKFKVNHFSFSDSELIGIRRSWNEELLTLLISNKNKFTFSGNAYAKNFDRNLLIKFKQAGCVFLGVGVESGSQDVIDNILQKGIDLKDTKTLIETSTDIGIPTGAWFMVGMPGETKNDIKKTIDFAKDLGALIVEVNIATPWPDTGFYYTSKKNGWLTSEVWSDYNEKKKSYISTPYLSDIEVVEYFELVLESLIKYGWKFEKGANRLYHPDFLWLTIKMNIGRVISRGVSMSDIRKLFRFVKIMLNNVKPSITQHRSID